MGAILGAILGAPFLLGVGAVLGAVLGAFLGSLILELFSGRELGGSSASFQGCNVGKGTGICRQGRSGYADYHFEHSQSILREKVVLNRQKAVVVTQDWLQECRVWVFR